MKSQNSCKKEINNIKKFYMKIIVCNYNFKKFMNFLFFLNYDKMKYR